jgi:hypothetical protein
MNGRNWDMPEDIHQDRFALMAALARAHDERPDDYAGSQSLISMSDDQLVAHATELLRTLEQQPLDDGAAVELRAALQRILGASLDEDPA